MRPDGQKSFGLHAIQPKDIVLMFQTKICLIVETFSLNSLSIAIPFKVECQ